jgi:hypothetical protein
MCVWPRRQQDYQHWYPEEVTFQPKLNESAMSREFLRKSLQKEGSSLAPNASGEDRHMALVNRLYASYEKVSRHNCWERLLAVLRLPGRLPAMLALNHVLTWLNMLVG